jgi:hypothetical protein
MMREAEVIEANLGIIPDDARGHERGVARVGAQQSRKPRAHHLLECGRRELIDTVDEQDGLTSVEIVLEELAC